MIRLAKSQSELVVVSILVNPTQFNDAKDFETYPRTLKGDMDKAQAAGADACFRLRRRRYGGQPKATPVHWAHSLKPTRVRDARAIFDGVVAVVDLLFQAVQPTLAVFGEKICNRSGSLRNWPRTVTQD